MPRSQKYYSLIYLNILKGLWYAICYVYWMSLEFNISSTKQSWIWFQFMFCLSIQIQFRGNQLLILPHFVATTSFLLSKLTMIILYFWDIKISSIFLHNCYCCSTIVRRIWRSYETRRVLCMTVKLYKYILKFSKVLLLRWKKQKSLLEREIKDMNISFYLQPWNARYVFKINLPTQ